MKLTVHHHTRYEFDQPVFLAPHIIRLTPRPDPSVRVLQHRLECTPPPAMQAQNLDLHGNSVAEVWFEGTTTALELDSVSVVESLLTDPFRFISAEPDRALPYTYPIDLRMRLATYVSEPASMSPDIRAIALDVASTAERRPERYPLALTMYLHQRFAMEVRPEGDPRPADATIAAGRGACRDLAVLFVDCCRAMGLAARFVSGYAHIPEASAELHAWGEVYLPGGGWRGFDPSWGLAVADRHVALAAGRDAREAAPVEGTFLGGGTSSLQTTVDVQAEPA